MLAVVDDVGRTGGEHLLDQFDDLADGLGRGDVGVRRNHPQRRHVLGEQRGFAIGQLAPADTVSFGPLEERIVDVGDVLHVVHAEPGVEPQPVYEIERQIGRGMAEMGGVVRGDAADVHGCGVTRGYRPHLPVGGVVQPQLRTASRHGRNAGALPRLHALDSRWFASGRL